MVTWSRWRFSVQFGGWAFILGGRVAIATVGALVVGGFLRILLFRVRFLDADTDGGLRLEIFTLEELLRLLVGVDEVLWLRNRKGGNTLIGRCR